MKGLVVCVLWLGMLGVIISHVRESQKPKLLDAFLMVNEHHGLSDWGLEQLDAILDQEEVR